MVSLKYRIGGKLRDPEDLDLVDVKAAESSFLNFKKNFVPYIKLFINTESYHCFREGMREL